MKIVVPTNSTKGLNDEIAEHFGRCDTYTFLNEEGKLLEVTKNTSEHTGGEGLPPELMKKNDANILLCRGLGPKALSLCEELNIKVYVYKAETVREIFDMWKNNKLKEASLRDACK